MYRGVKVMPYSTGCTTTLSNFEANMNYQDVSDPSVVVSFPLVEDPTTSLLAWTTTPWTLVSNLGLCVNPKFKYVKIKDTKTGLAGLQDCAVGTAAAAARGFNEQQISSGQSGKPPESSNLRWHA